MSDCNFSACTLCTVLTDSSSPLLWWFLASILVIIFILFILNTFCHHSSKFEVFRYSVVVKTFFRSRDQDRDLGIQASRPRPRPWPPDLETKTETWVFRSRDQDRDLGLQVSRPRPRPRPGQNELESQDHGLEITTLTASIQLVTEHSLKGATNYGNRATGVGTRHAVLRARPISWTSGLETNTETLTK